MGGFLKDFAQGFFETSANTLTERKKLNDVVDAERKKALALVDPQADLYKRQKEIDLDYETRKQQAQDDQFATFLGKMQTPGASPQAAGTPSVESPGNMFGGTSNPTATPPTDPAAVHQKLQEALRLKAAAQASGNTKRAQFYDTQVDSLKAQYTYLIDNIKSGGKPATGAEGGNIVESIEKRFTDESKPGSASTSRYMPDKLNKFVNDPTVRAEHEGSKNMHKALANAVANAKKEQITSATPEVSDLIVDGTEKVIKNLNTLNSTNPQISPEDKKQAAQEVENYFNSFSPLEKERLQNDVNFKAVFDESVISQINAILHPDTAATTSADNPAAPVELKPQQAPSYTDGQTIINKKTGARMIYKGGKWQPL